MIRKISTFLTLSLCLVVAFATKSGATTWNVVAQTVGASNMFVYDAQMGTIGVNVGDTIAFKWVSGTHNVKSTSGPSGSPLWTAFGNPTALDLDISHTQQSYKVEAPGNYTYTCGLHPTMVGVFAAHFKTGVGNLFTEAGIVISPNPATSLVTIKSGLANPVVSLTNIIGKNIGTFNGVETTEGTTINVANVPSGTYFITLSSKEMVITRRIVIAH